MVPKTERFEMRLDPVLVERVDRWREGQDDMPSRAEAIRRLVEQALQGSSKDLRPTQSEKLLMWMLAELLKQQGQERETAELVQKAIYGGHYWALDWELTGILHSHADRREAVTLVVDTLDMWTFIERAHTGFSEAEKERVEAEVGPWAKNPKFSGFDGNNETEYMSIARFLVEDMDRFQSFKGRSLNSHSPRVERCRSMTAIFEPIRVRLVGRELNPDEMIELLKLD